MIVVTNEFIDDPDSRFFDLLRVDLERTSFHASLLAGGSRTAKGEGRRRDGS